MKKIKILFVLILAIFAGCSENKSDEQLNNAKVIGYATKTNALYEIEYEGHKYLYLYHGGILHSESCPCKNN